MLLTNTSHHAFSATPVASPSRSLDALDEDGHKLVDASTDSSCNNVLLSRSSRRRLDVLQPSNTASGQVPGTTKP